MYCISLIFLKPSNPFFSLSFSHHIYFVGLPEGADVAKLLHHAMQIYINDGSQHCLKDNIIIYTQKWNTYMHQQVNSTHGGLISYLLLEAPQRVLQSSTRSPELPQQRQLQQPKRWQKEKNSSTLKKRHKKKSNEIRPVWRCSHLWLPTCADLHHATRHRAADGKTLKHPTDRVGQTQSYKLLMQGEEIQNNMF